MKDIEALLKQSSNPKPRRPLRANFTNNVTSYLAQNPRRSWRVTYMEIFMEWFKKPAAALAALAVVTMAGGTAYASVGGWPGVVALFGGEKTLADGSRIVQVDTKNCSMSNAFTVAEAGKQQNAWYYRVKDGSKLTNDQIVEMVQGNCFVEAQVQFDQKVIHDALNSNPLNKDRVVGGYIDSVVTAVSTQAISIESVIPYDTELKTVKQTFNHIAPDVLVYESPNKLTLADIKVGDHVSIKYRASGNALTHSETTAPDKINTNEQVVVMINKNTPAMTAAVNYLKYNGQEFEQVQPCSAHPSGYCNYEQFIKQ